MTDVATTAAPTAATPTPASKPAPGSHELVAHHARAAQLAVLADAEKAAAGLLSAKDEASDEGAAQAPQRGADGKFLPAVKKADDTKAAKTETAPAEKPKEEVSAPAVGGGLGAARKLVREGDIGKALELIGLDPAKLEGKQWGAFRQREHAAREMEARAHAKSAELDSVARQIAARFEPFAKAKAAYDAGEFDEAFKLAFNEDPNEYARKRVHSMSTKDPEVAQLKKELQALRVERERQAQEQQERSDAQQLQAKVAEYRAGLATELEADARFVRVAKKPAFINRVFDIQKEHYNPRTDSTLDLVEAAEMAWDELYDGVAGDVSPPTAATASQPTGPVKPVRQGARASTTLNTREAAEAAPARKLAPGSKELLEHYARMAESAVLKNAG